MSASRCKQYRNTLEQQIPNFKTPVLCKLAQLVLVLLQKAGVEVRQVLCNVLDILLAGQNGGPAQHTHSECLIPVRLHTSSP